MSKRDLVLRLAAGLLIAGLAADYGLNFLANRAGSPTYEPDGLGAIEEHAGGATPNLDDRYAKDGRHKTTTPPPAYKVPGMPAVLDQGTTPQCVAYAASTLKAWQDTEGTFNFDEATFFRRIGGTADGAYIRDAFKEMLATGYPVVSVGQADQHRIASYWTVNATVANLKAALVDYGPLDVISPWYHSWFYPRSGVLPAPDYDVGGHSFIVYGYDDARGAWLIRNSWGTDWGANGDAWLPYAYTGNIWSWWSAQDVVATPNTYAMTVDILVPPVPRLFTVPAGTTLSGYDPARPGAPVLTRTFTTTSSAHADADVALSWSGAQVSPSGSGWLRVTDGIYAGLLIPKVQVVLEPVPAPSPSPTPAPTAAPTPSTEPSAGPSAEPTRSEAPTVAPTALPTVAPSLAPQVTASPQPTAVPAEPTPTPVPTPNPTVTPAPVQPSGHAPWWLVVLAVMVVAMIGARRSR